MVVYTEYPADNVTNNTNINVDYYCCNSYNLYMDSIVIHVPEAELLKSAGTDYKVILDSLVKENIIVSYKPVMEVIVDKAKARHVQTVLEFYDLRESPTGRTKTPKDED